MANQSQVLEIILVGFPGLKEEFYVPVSLVMFLLYIASLSANGAVIGLVVLKKRLHKPMYLIIANLAVADLLFDTITLPKIVAKYWFGVQMSFPECLLQMFFIHYLNTTESYIFMLMAIDRYFAICKPLRYSSIISKKVVVISCCICWVVASFTALTALIMNSQAPPCGYNKINTLMCTNIAVTALACKDVSIIKNTTFIFSMFILFVPLSLVIPSYIIIINIIRLSSTSENWQKAFPTCTTHLLVLTLSYAPRVFVYTAHVVGLVFNADLNVFVLCLYSYVPHISNPIIYCLRNMEIKQTFVTSISGVIGFRERSQLFPNTVTK